MRNKKKPRACLLLLHDIQFDNRVLRHASTLKRAGYDTKIFCVHGGLEDNLEKKHFGIKVKFLSRPVFLQWIKPSVIYALFAQPLKDVLPKLIFDHAESWLLKLMGRGISLLRNVPVKVFLAISRPVWLAFFNTSKLVWPMFFETPLSQKLGETGADIYAANDLPALPYCFRAARANKAKLIYDSHELFLSSFAFSTKGIKTVSGKLMLKLRRLVWGLAERFLIRRADLNITVNRPIARQLGRKYRIVTPLVIRSMFEFQKVKRLKRFHKLYKLTPKTKIILYQGLIAPGRGMEPIIKSLQFLGERFVVVFLGYANNENYLTDLKQTVRTSKLHHRVFFHPAVKKDELMNLTAAADVGCILRTKEDNLSWYYSLPNKLFEYMMAGLPIITSDLPEIEKIVKKEKVGAIVKNPKNPQEIAQVVNYLVEPKRWNRYHKNCLKAAKTKYNWEEEEQKLIKIYGSWINRK